MGKFFRSEPSFKRFLSVKFSQSPIETLRDDFCPRRAYTPTVFDDRSRANFLPVPLNELTIIGTDPSGNFFWISLLSRAELMLIRDPVSLIYSLCSLQLLADGINCQSQDCALAGGCTIDNLGFFTRPVSLSNAVDSSFSGRLITWFFKVIEESGQTLVNFEPIPEKLSSKASLT